MPTLTDREIIALLGGVSAVARRLKVQPPTVSGYLTDGIPEPRLKELAAELEECSGGRFSRRERWPDQCERIWPDLRRATGAANDAGAQGAAA